MRVTFLWCLLAWLAAGCSEEPVAEIASPADTADDDRPNFLLIVADDMGYSDLGVLGGEIDTPNLDALAETGLLLTNFHTAASCAPTRSMLLAGTDHHLAGMGAPPEFMDLAAPELLGRPGYEGYLNDRVVALPRLLRDAGYRTYMTGKWHLGYEAHTSPFARGFERTFALLDGAATHFSDLQVVPGSPRKTASFRRDGVLADIPRDFYSTRDYARELIRFLEMDQARAEPFFAYLAFTAPHWPLQAPDESIAKYNGVYDQGWEVHFERRLQRQKELGLVDSSLSGPPLAPGSRTWGDLSETERRASVREMQVYAAMVDDMDRYIGEVVATLKALGEYDNTVIVFLSDNGAEGGDENRHPLFKQFVEGFDNSFENLGRDGSFVFYGREWARVSNVPNRFFKSTAAEGGIRTPAIVSYPAATLGAARHDGLLSVMDIAPTLLDLAETEHPGTVYAGREIHAPQGRSFRALLAGDSGPVRGPEDVLAFEQTHQRALIRGDWKIAAVQRPNSDGAWRLFNLADDRSETVDLSAEHPELFEELLGLWQTYAAENGVASLDEILKQRAAAQAVNARQGRGESE